VYFLYLNLNGEDGKGRKEGKKVLRILGSSVGGKREGEENF